MKRMSPSALNQTIVCGIADLETRIDPGVSHILSILDPGFVEPSALLGASGQRRTTLRFDDAILPGDDTILPSVRDIEAIRDFARALGSNEVARVIVHCHYGTSRSPAALAIILAETDPTLSEDAVFEQVLTIRPRAWPNSLMIALADEAMGRSGRFVEALRRVYGRQLAAHPELRELAIRLDRRAEIEAAIPYSN